MRSGCALRSRYLRMMSTSKTMGTLTSPGFAPSRPELADTLHAPAGLKPFLGQLRSVVVQCPHVHHALEARTVTGDVGGVVDNVPRCGMVYLNGRSEPGSTLRTSRPPSGACLTS